MKDAACLQGQARGHHRAALARRYRYQIEGYLVAIHAEQASAEIQRMQLC